jgi:hypothetical protein
MSEKLKMILCTKLKFEKKNSLYVIQFKFIIL